MKPDQKLLNKLRAKPIVEEEEEEDTPATKGSLDHVMKNVSLSNNASDVPAGTHEAIIQEFVLQAPDTKGRSVRVKFEMIEEPFAGKTMTTWFKMLQDDLITEVEGGVRALKLALAKLGYEEPSSEKELTKYLAEITKEHPGVLIRVTYDGQWTRIRIDDRSDSDVVEAYKDNIPY